jgi:hydrogenase expression/formation protein HypC
MCLGIPSRIIKINGNVATVEVGGVRRQAYLHFVPGVKVGQWVLIHTGFAIQVLSEQQAQETLKLLEEMQEAADRR